MKRAGGRVSPLGGEVKSDNRSMRKQKARSCYGRGGRWGRAGDEDREVATYFWNIGAFPKNVGDFLKNVGLFLENVGDFREYLGRFWGAGRREISASRGEVCDVAQEYLCHAQRQVSRWAQKQEGCMEWSRWWVANNRRNQAKKSFWKIDMAKKARIVGSITENCYFCVANKNNK